MEIRRSDDYSKWLFDQVTIRLNEIQINFFSPCSYRTNRSSRSGYISNEYQTKWLVDQVNIRLTLGLCGIRPNGVRQTDDQNKWYQPVWLLDDLGIRRCENQTKW